MVRTSKRPLVAGKISPLHATIVAGSWGIGGVALLATHVNPLTGRASSSSLHPRSAVTGADVRRVWCVQVCWPPPTSGCTRWSTRP
eukprot:3864835-Rhodomonas_salina.1